MFPRHPKGSAAIGALADGLRAECADLDRLAGSVSDPDWSEHTARRAVRRHTDQITGRVRELAELIQDYGAAVADFDERVERLNAQWVIESECRFGVPSPGADEAATPAEVAAMDQEHADLVWNARAEVVRALRAEYDQARADLEAAGIAFDRGTGHRPG